MLGVVVCSAYGVTFAVRQLSLDCIAIPTLLIEQGRGHAAEPVAGHVLAGVTHTAKRAGDCILAHGTVATADAREGERKATSERLQLTKDDQGLGRQRDNVLNARLHAGRRNPPLCFVEIELRPLCLAKLARSDKYQGSKTQSAARGERAF